MEELLFPYQLRGKMKNAKIQVENGFIALKPIFSMLGIRTASVPGSQTVSIGGQEQAGADLTHLDDWLRKLTPRSVILDHVTDHLCAMIRGQSVDLLAQDAKKKVEILQFSENEPTLITQPLDGVDYFRKDSSTGPHRLEPHVIQYTALTGVLDLFIRPEQSVWGGREEIQHRIMPIGKEEWREGLLRDLRQANAEVLTGPQMLQKYPKHKTVQRRKIPERQEVIPDPGNNQSGRIVLIPEHDQVFNWERAGATSDRKKTELSRGTHRTKRTPL